MCQEPLDGGRGGDAGGCASVTSGSAMVTSRRPWLWLGRERGPCGDILPRSVHRGSGFGPRERGPGNAHLSPRCLEARCLSLGCRATRPTRSSGPFQSLPHPLLPRRATLGPLPTEQTLHPRRRSVKMPVMSPGEEATPPNPQFGTDSLGSPPPVTSDTLEGDPNARACGAAWRQRLSAAVSKASGRRDQRAAWRTCPGG